ncbi:MAG: hypothetical protein MUD10_02790 [Candidatus Pacebacteria bacterium]|jgi:hypothetical protein|nr:hypothetical protein [Candidatus Paceibacterota bacterium]
MSKIIKFVFALSVIFVFSLIFAGQANAQAASGCVTSSWANIAGNGADAKLNVTNRANCAAKQVSLCSYRVYIRPNAAGWLSTQTLFDSQVMTLQPGQTATMTVRTDNCMTQVDAYEGPCVNPFTSDNTSVPYIFAGRMTEYTETMCVKCTDECTEGQRVCDGNGYKTCVKGSNGCTKWDTKIDCKSWETCSNGSCNINNPTIDLRTSGDVVCNRNADLIWTSTNAESCVASGSWTGNKNTSGTEGVGNFTGARTYTLTCSNGGGSATDSVTLTGQEDNLQANAGPDQDVDAGDEVTLEGSVSGAGFGGSPTISWSCTGGTLSNRASLRPTLSIDEDEDDATYTCTMTAKNDCATDSDTMKVQITKKTYNFNVALTTSPDSGCAPLRDVDMTAKLTNYGSYDGDYTYYFDCENDGDWDKTVTTDETRYTASNLCDYANIDTYTAKVKVTASGRTVTDTATVRAENCEREEEPKPVPGVVSITKNVRNVTAGGGYQGTVSAKPNDTVSYRIEVVGRSGKSDNVIVRDAAPAGIANVRNVQVSGFNLGGNLVSGINLDSLLAGDVRVITFDATVAGEGSFAYGQTTLTNTATVTANGTSANSTAAVQVYRSGVQGATTVSTGFDSKTFTGIAFGVLGALAALSWLLRAKLKFFLVRDPKKQLLRKIAFVKANGLAR